MEFESPKNILKWLRGHLIVVDPTAMEEIRQGLKRVSDLEKMHRVMHNDHSIEWEVRQDKEPPNKRYLTEQLEMLCVVHPLTENEASHKMKLILDHRSEFPTKLCTAIEQIHGSNLHAPADAWTFLSQVYEETKKFFLGHDPSTFNATNINHERLIISGEWLGLDKDIDTEDQAEIAIRFFPMVLTEHLQLPYAILNPIQLLLSKEKAVSFAPLLAKLLTEAGEYLQRQAIVRVGLRKIFELLLTNYFARVVNGGKISKSFDNESLAALARLRENGFVENADVGVLAMSLLVHSIKAERDIDFVETRFRLLVSWCPSILMDGGTSNRPLLHTIYNESSRSNCKSRLFLRLFQVLSELGMIHYPDELGFVFHKWGGTFPLNRFASIHGREQIAEIVNDKLVSTLGSNVKTLPLLISAAATNDKIHLDGLYRLLCLNPIGFKPKSQNQCPLATC